ncbi:MAG: quinolinate synthase [Bacteroidetes bacterium HGW-Bacteroidetes-21]|nr:MAG: quinolinate synthase [Bacteroidetes bacterium HGW-Bacteroidetes-21]
METLISKIQELKLKKNAVILAHYYQTGNIQDIADHIGDSLQLSQQAADTKADIIVFAGVHFMAETAKMLSPDKKVLIPDLEAGCSLADSIKAEDFAEFKKKYPNHLVVSYINTTAEIKAMTDICCTSSNAIEIVQSIPADQPIIFTPDKNLGDYINRTTGRNMVIWNGACHVHEQFSLQRILEIKKAHPEAKIIAHPECQKPILIVSDFIGSTAALLKFTQKDNTKEYIVATESGILHQMKKANPSKVFIPAPPVDSTCGCNDCQFMKLITLEKIYKSLVDEQFEINLSDKIIQKAVIPIQRMLEVSRKAGLI